MKRYLLRYFQKSFLSKHKDMNSLKLKRRCKRMIYRDHPLMHFSLVNPVVDQAYQRDYLHILFEKLCLLYRHTEKSDPKPQ